MSTTRSRAFQVKSATQPSISSIISSRRPDQASPGRRVRPGRVHRTARQRCQRRPSAPGGQRRPHREHAPAGPRPGGGTRYEIPHDLLVPTIKKLGDRADRQRGRNGIALSVRRKQPSSRPRPKSSGRRPKREASSEVPHGNHRVGYRLVRRSPPGGYRRAGQAIRGRPITRRPVSGHGGRGHEPAARGRPAGPAPQPAGLYERASTPQAESVLIQAAQQPLDGLLVPGSTVGVWRSARTGGPWPPGKPAVTLACGTWRRGDKAATPDRGQLRSTVSHSARTGGSWPSATIAVISACGTWRPGTKPPPWMRAASSTVSRSARTGGTWPPATAAVISACGTWRPGRKPPPWMRGTSSRLSRSARTGGSWPSATSGACRLVGRGDPAENRHPGRREPSGLRCRVQSGRADPGRRRPWRACRLVGRGDRARKPPPWPKAAPPELSRSVRTGGPWPAGNAGGRVGLVGRGDQAEDRHRGRGEPVVCCRVQPRRADPGRRRRRRLRRSVDTLTAQMPSNLAEGSPVDSVAFSPDGRTLAVGDYGGYVGLWDVATGPEDHRPARRRPGR